jgi:tyrosine-protein phosphatase SIW14
MIDGAAATADETRGIPYASIFVIARKMNNPLRLGAVFLTALATGFLPEATSAQDLTGLRNFHNVNSQIYRGGQPTLQGFQKLAQLGIRTVIDLREPGDRSLAEKKIVEGAGMRYVSVPMRGFQTPTSEQITKVLSLFNDSTAGPVFVHCRRGADRTGTVVACYRISHDGWENTRALAEARSLGMSFFQRALQNFVLHYKPDQNVAAPTTSQPITAPALAVVPAN